LIKIKSSLYTRVILFFVLNLMVIMGILACFLFFDRANCFRLFMGSHAEDRTTIAGRMILKDLSFAKQDRWSAILTQHAQIQGVNFYIATQDGQIYASTTQPLPDIVQKKLALFFKRYEQQNNAEQDESNSYPRVGKGFPGHKDTDKRWKHKKKGSHIQHSFTTDAPRQYWTEFSDMVYLDLLSKKIRVIIFASSDSITGNGFFFDPLPWAMVFGATIIFSILLWIPLIHTITAPLSRMTRFAEKIAGGDLEIRICEKRADEIGRLALAINHMTSRLSGLVKGQKRFLGDIAHELGAPLSRIQVGLGIMEQQLESKHQNRVMDIMEDVVDLSNLINELLSFSRAEVSPNAVSLHKTQLLPLVERAVKRETDGQTFFKISIDPKIHIMADPELIVRALSNLIRNAIKYAASSGHIEISAQRSSEEVVLSLRDHGPGLPEEELDQIFEPFFRTDPSRDRETGGVGLGLAIVKSCIHACGGRVIAENHADGGLIISFYFSIIVSSNI